MISMFPGQKKRQFCLQVTLDLARLEELFFPSNDCTAYAEIHMQVTVLTFGDFYDIWVSSARRFIMQLNIMKT